MKIDAPVVPTRHLFWCRCGFLSVVTAVCWQANLGWYVGVVLIGGILLWVLEEKISCVHLSANDPEHLWDIGICSKRQSRQLWQGYLVGIEKFGFGLYLQFDIIEPMKRSYGVWVFKNSTDEITFAKLSMLARAGV